MENERILRIEDDLFKCQMFNLKNDEDENHIENYAKRILRKQQISLPKYNDIVTQDINSQKQISTYKGSDNIQINFIG